MGCRLICDSYGPFGFHSEVFHVNVDEFKVDYGDGSVATIMFVMPEQKTRESFARYVVRQGRTCSSRKFDGNFWNEKEG